MPVHFTTVLYPVKDVEAAKALFTVALGVEPHADSPYYVGFAVDGHEIGLVPGGHDRGMTGPVPFYDVEDLTASLDALSAAGGRVTQDPTPVGGGLVVAEGGRRRRERDRPAQLPDCWPESSDAGRATVRGDGSPWGLPPLVLHGRRRHHRRADRVVDERSHHACKGGRPAGRQRSPDG